MCLTVFAYKVHPDYPLIFASNRDEFYDRPASPATFWYDHPSLLAGRDLKAGGTWLGITRDYRFAAITNYRDMSAIKKNAPSRGDIITNYISSNLATPEFLSLLKKSADSYNGFNLIAGDVNDLWYYTNQKDDPVQIEPGYHTLSNAFLDTPWPKTEKALSEFKTVINEHGPEENRIFELLQNTERYPDESLPSTGLSAEMERVVSSIFITSKNYGTRCSTVICSNPDADTTFTEITYKKGEVEIDKTVRYRF